MILTYHEGACIRASAGDTTIVFSPVSKKSTNFKPTNFGADVVFISVNNRDMNGSDEATRGEKQPFVLTGPGEYEIKEISVAAFPSRSEYGGEERINTVYSVHFDGLSLLYVGALSDAALPAEVWEMDAPDILLVPIGGNGTLNAAEAHKLAVKLESKIIIPILYDKNSLTTFLKETSSEAKPVDKLTVKPRDLADKDGEVVVLAA